MAFASAVNFAALSNLQSLAAGACKGLGQVGAAATSYVDMIGSPIQIKTGTGVNPAAGQIVLFLVESLDGTNWTDGILPNAVTTQHAKIGDASLSNIVYRLGKGPSQLADATVLTFPGFSVLNVFGYRPTFWAPVIWNLSGAPLDATLASFAGASVIQT